MLVAAHGLHASERKRNKREVFVGNRCSFRDKHCARKKHCYAKISLVLRFHFRMESLMKPLQCFFVSSLISSVIDCYGG